MKTVRVLQPVVVPALLAMLASACAATSDRGPSEEAAGSNVKQPEMWSSADDPALFSSVLEKQASALPDSGEASTIPWAGNYWPTYRDSINYPWAGAGSDAPSTKYGKAFGVTGVEDAISSFRGIDSTNGKTCTDDSGCDATLTEVCAKRTGQTSGKCVQSWMGICHAWTPASILLPEPKHDVTLNGVTFHVQDIKALATLVHDNVTNKFVSLRCDKNDSKGEIHYDDAGRVVDSDRECRDTNPGTFHILLANYLGKNHQSFIEDRTFDYQVWNQPLRGYKVNAKQPLTAQQANEKLGLTTVGGTTQKQSGTIAQSAWQHYAAVTVTPGSSYRVHLTGTGDADLYVRAGAQPDASSYDCRPYLNGSDEMCSGTVPAGVTQLFVSVNGYAPTSTFALDITSGGTTPTGYVYDTQAVSFVYYQTDVFYITESAQSTDGNLSSTIDRYTGKDSYEYILELDAAGKIIGGEWVGSSAKLHPDFVWLPLAVGQPSVAGDKVQYADVKRLVDLSVADASSTGGGTGSAQTFSATGAPNKGDFPQYGPFHVTSGNLVATITGTGDADLYVKKGMAPTVTAWDCRPYVNGSSEQCTITGPADVYVGVRGYAPTSTFKLSVTYTGRP